MRALKKCWVQLEPNQEIANDEVSVHTILESLGVLADYPLRQQRETAFTFEEDIENLRERYESEAIVGGAVSSASTTTSHVASAEPTPARLTPEREGSVGFPFQSSRQQPWSQPTNPFQQMSAQSINQQQQPSSMVSTGPPGFLSHTASAPSSVFESPAEYLQSRQSWHPEPLSHVQSEPNIVSAPATYWNTPQPPPWQTDQPQSSWQQMQHRGSWPAEQHHDESQYATQEDPHYSTVDPADLMLATTTSPYFESQEAWDEFYRRMQERRQR